MALGHRRGRTCVEADTWSTAAVVRGRGAAGLLAGRHLAARLVGEDGVPLHVGGWPAGAGVRSGVQALEVGSGSRSGPEAVPERATA